MIERIVARNPKESCVGSFICCGHRDPTMPCGPSALTMASSRRPGYALPWVWRVRLPPSLGLASQRGLSFTGFVQSQAGSDFSHAPEQSNGLVSGKMQAYCRSSVRPAPAPGLALLNSWPLMALPPADMLGGRRGAPVIGFFPVRGDGDSIMNGSAGCPNVVTKSASPRMMSHVLRPLSVLHVHLRRALVAAGRLPVRSMPAMRSGSPLASCRAMSCQARRRSRRGRRGWGRASTGAGSAPVYRSWRRPWGW